MIVVGILLRTAQPHFELVASVKLFTELTTFDASAAIAAI
jgi:hypothetical protein